jgi:Ni,Fe-hydrogenase III component G
MREEEIVNSLCGKFPFLQDRIYVQKDKRIFTKALDRAEFEQIIRYVHDEMNFFRAHHVVGTDDGENLGFLYILSNDENIILVLRECAPKSSPVIKSVSDMYPSVVLHERELVDLFGAVVEGLPDGPSYPLPDGWPKGSYPMRKDWNPKYFNKETMTYEPPEDKEAEK